MMPRKAKRNTSTPEFVDALREFHRAIVLTERVKRLAKHGSVGLAFATAHEQLVDYIWHDVCRIATTHTDRCFVIRFNYKSPNAAERVYSAITYRNVD